MFSLFTRGNSITGPLNIGEDCPGEEKSIGCPPFWLYGIGEIYRVQNEENCPNRRVSFHFPCICGDMLISAQDAGGAMWADRDQESFASVIARRSGHLYRQMADCREVLHWSKSLALQT
jgi:hypothetical protein